MKYFLSKFRPCTLYVKVYKNTFAIRYIEKTKESKKISSKKFTTERLLIGEFVPAHECMSQLLKELVETNFMFLAPTFVMHQIEMNEGGLSAVEERVLLELAGINGAYKTKVWSGHILKDNEVLKYAKA